MAAPDGNGQTAARTAHFDVVLRGYNQRQVNERVTRLEFDLKNANRSRDAAAAQVAELSKVVAGTRAELDKVKTQLSSLANSPISASNVTERVRIMMGLAEEEIADIRKAAVDHANATRAEADRFAAEQKALHQRKHGETEDRRRQLEAQHQQHRIDLDQKFEQRKAELEAEHKELRTKLNTEQQELKAKLSAEHNALMAETRAETERVTTEYDAKAADLEKNRVALEQKYKKYHDDLDKEYDELRTKLKKEHEQLVVTAKVAAEKIVTDAEARKVAAEKSLAESLAAKKAESEKLLAELESEALAKVEALTTSAAARAEKTVKDADEHAGRRVTEANDRVTALRTMHQTLTEQFAAAQAAVLQAVSVLGPLPEDPHVGSGSAGAKAVDPDSPTAKLPIQKKAKDA
ncbi:hypothetical protein [Umezawaea tangerina]|uniref:V/A-type H+-transporting ATPase subunit G/H n=1 Tax=Umezawaea tangerina TaxID=84725 RepID=A0A2T0TAP5_9PSEU|nr:hypothetical protein [Umezawaea tangerina]PRY42731.1 V/A-type H+-transporting ATPase subunit G/H [Umezawaea tangerina]